MSLGICSNVVFPRYVYTIDPYAVAGSYILGVRWGPSGCTNQEVTEGRPTLQKEKAEAVQIQKALRGGIGDNTKMKGRGYTNKEGTEGQNRRQYREEWQKAQRGEDRRQYKGWKEMRGEERRRRGG